MQLAIILMFNVFSLCVKGQTSEAPNYSCSGNGDDIKITLSSLSHSAWQPAPTCAVQQCNASSINNSTCRLSSTPCFAYRTINNSSYCAPGALCSILESCNNTTYTCASPTSVCVINSCCTPQAVCLPFSIVDLCTSDWSTTTTSTTSSTTTSTTPVSSTTSSSSATTASLPATVTTNATTSGFYGTEHVTLSSSTSLINLTITIIVQKTVGATWAGMFNNFPGGSMTESHADTGTQIIYTWMTINGQTIGTNSGPYTATAQFNLGGTVQPTNSDTYTVAMISTNGQTSTTSGHF